MKNHIKNFLHSHHFKYIICLQFIAVWLRTNTHHESPELAHELGPDRAYAWL